VDKSRLAKLLSLTQSDNDSEALSAMRMANGMLKKENMTWQQILGDSPLIQSKQRGPVRDDVGDAINWWVKQQMDNMNDMVRKAAQQQAQQQKTRLIVLQMINVCKIKGGGTNKMDEIANKLNQGQMPTATEIQYVQAIYDVIGRQP